MPRSSGSHLISEIVVGGQEDKIQRQMKIKIGGPLRCLFVTLHIVRITKADSQLNINHIIDYNTFSKFLQEDMVYCKSCVNKFVKEYCKQSLRDFVTYFTSNRQQKLSSI